MLNGGMRIKNGEYYEKKNLEQAIKEMKLMQEGKMPKQTWKSFLEQLEKETRNKC